MNGFRYISDGKLVKCDVARIGPHEEIDSSRWKLDKLFEGLKESVRASLLENIYSRTEIFRDRSDSNKILFKFLPLPWALINDPREREERNTPRTRKNGKGLKVFVKKGFPLGRGVCLNRKTSAVNLEWWLRPANNQMTFIYHSHHESNPSLHSLLPSLFSPYSRHQFLLWINMV